MSFLDLDEWLIDLAGRRGRRLLAAHRRQGVPRGVDVALVEGAVANEDHLREIRTGPPAHAGFWSRSATAP